MLLVGVQADEKREGREEPFCVVVQGVACAVRLTQGHPQQVTESSYHQGA